MGRRPRHLPNYSKPPLIEVALSVQFKELTQFRTVHAGLFWEKCKRKFPNFAEHPPINPVFETFGGKPRLSFSPKIELVSGLQVPRYWFLDKSENRLIQIQADRFIHNWRKVQTKDKYPRYEDIKKQFLTEFKKFKRFIKENNLGRVFPNQVEITYVNHITSEKNEGLHKSFGNVFSIWNNRRFSKNVGALEVEQFSSKFVIDGHKGGPIGRLHVKAIPAVNSAGELIIQFELVARGNLEKPTIKAVEEFMDLGREKIIFGFTELTTPKMHERWGRKK